MSKKTFIPKRQGNLPKHKMPSAPTATPAPASSSASAPAPASSSASTPMQAPSIHNPMQAPSMQTDPIQNPTPTPNNQSTNNMAELEQKNNQPAPNLEPKIAPKDDKLSKDQQEKSKEWHRIIRQTLTEKNNEKGLALLEQAIKELPDQLWFQYRLSVLYYELGRRSEALSTLEKVCEKEPNNPDYAMALGTFYYDNPERDFQKAISHIKRTLELKPFEQQAWRNYGVILYKYGQVEKGLEALYRAVQLAPNDFATTNALCMYLTEQKRRDEAQTFGAIGMFNKHLDGLQEFEKMNLPDDLKKLKPQPTKKAGMKNVFAFSLWGADETYTRGMVENVEIMPKFFPNWVVRCYHDESVPPSIIEEIKQAGGETVLMTGKMRDLNPGMWRFLVANDPDVYYFCCRDADCRPFDREQAAVEEWVASGKSFHILRDDIWHNELMLAGLWGGIAGMLPDMGRLIDATFQKSTNRWHDQIFLKNYIWPIIYKDSLQHDGNYHLFGAINYPLPRVAGDSMHVGYGHKAGKKNEKHSYNIAKNDDENFDEMLKRIWYENLNRDPSVQEIEIADPMGKRIVLRRLPNSSDYETIRPSS